MIHRTIPWLSMLTKLISASCLRIETFFAYVREEEGMKRASANCNTSALLPPILSILSQRRFIRQYPVSVSMPPLPTLRPGQYIRGFEEICFNEHGGGKKDSDEAGGRGVQEIKVMRLEVSMSLPQGKRVQRLQHMASVWDCYEMHRPPFLETWIWSNTLSKKLEDEL